MNPKLVVVLCTNHGLNVSNLFSDMFLFGLEEIIQLDRSHNLASSSNKLNQDDTLIFKILIKLVILFF